MSFIGCQFLGRFGNNLFGYAFARGFAERNGLELHTDPWIGQKIFEINDPPIDYRAQHIHRDENTFKDDDRNFIYRSYSQNQKCADYYSVEQIRRWFKFRPEIEELLKDINVARVVAHQRKGDYCGHGFPVISENAFKKAVEEADYDLMHLYIASEESPIRVPGLSGELSFLPDFYLMMNAWVLFRGNSTFSWWAAALNTGKIYAPIIKGLKGGNEHDDVKFVEGNWPACSDFHFVTDIHLKP